MNIGPKYICKYYMNVCNNEKIACKYLILLELAIQHYGVSARLHQGCIFFCHPPPSFWSAMERG